ncbi:MAG: N-acetyltransferase family protein [bacterium]
MIQKVDAAKMNIRDFSSEDWNDVARIYKEGLDTGIASFETEVPSFEVWDQKFHKVCRLVALDNDYVIGFALLAPTSRRKVYAGVAEITIYISKQYHSQGVGDALLKALISASENHGFWTLQSGIFPQNIASIKLHEKNGFRVLGVRHKVAQRDNIWYDNVLLERRSKLQKFN